MKNKFGHFLSNLVLSMISQHDRLVTKLGKSVREIDQRLPDFAIFLLFLIKKLLFIKRKYEIRICQLFTLLGT